MTPQPTAHEDTKSGLAPSNPTKEGPAVGHTVDARPVCSSMTVAGRRCRVRVAAAGDVCGLHRMTSEERHDASKLGALVLRSHQAEGAVVEAQDAAQEAAQALPGAVVVLPDFSTPTTIANYLADVATKIDRRELAPSQGAAITGAAMAALRALELANEIQLLGREVAVMRDRMARPR
jgi:hypothetical protein